MKAIWLADGYAGHKEMFYIQPIRTDGDLVLLRCAEPGKEYLLRWAHREEIKHAKKGG